MRLATSRRAVRHRSVQVAVEEYQRTAASSERLVAQVRVAPPLTRPSSSG